MVEMQLAHCSIERNITVYCAETSVIHHGGGTWYVRYIHTVDIHSIHRPCKLRFTVQYIVLFPVITLGFYTHC
jgi:hypothetical protein